MTQDLAALSHALLDAARKAGAEAADTLAIEGRSVMIDVREGELEQAERSESTDLGLRVLIGRKQAIVSASDTRPETLALMAERAVAMAREAPDDPHAGLADPSQLTQDTGSAALDLFDPAPEPAAEALPWGIDESQLTMRVRWWTDPVRTNVVHTQARVIQAISTALDEAAIDMPYPTNVVLLHDQTEETDGTRGAQREGWPAGDKPPQSRQKVEMKARARRDRAMAPPRSGHEDGDSGAAPEDGDAI